MIALPDVNVLLALAWDNHPHHDVAHTWFAREAADGWATCLFTQTAFLRLSLNPQIVGGSLDCFAALDLLEKLTAHPLHRFIEVAPTITSGPFRALQRSISGYRQVTDATLLHLARSHGLKLVTLDQSFDAICPWPESLEVLSLAD